MLPLKKFNLLQILLRAVSSCMVTKSVKGYRDISASVLNVT